MIKIAICDDEVKMVQHISVLVNNFFAFYPQEFDIACFDNAEAFLQSPLEVYNIVLLDVQIGNASGLSVAEKLREKNQHTVLIFISQFNDYATDGYRVNAFRYILKSTLPTFFKKDFKSAIDKIDIENQKFEFKNYSEQVRIFRDNIICFESKGTKIILHVINEPKSEYSFYDRLDNVEKLLENSTFVRVQKSMLINAKYISKIGSYKVYMHSGDIYSASRTNYTCMIKRYAKIKGDL